jgi:hypothetical protein
MIAPNVRQRRGVVLRMVTTVPLALVLAAAIGSGTAPSATVLDPVAATQPVSTATQPVSTVTQPITQATQPVTTTVTQPVAQATQPISTVTQPIAQATQPVVSTVTQPVARATQPVSTVTQPVAQATQPISSVTQPIAEATQPVVSTVTQPVAQATQPASTVTEPVAAAAQPIAGTASSTVKAAAPLTAGIAKSTDTASGTTGGGARTVAETTGPVAATGSGSVEPQTDVSAVAPSAPATPMLGASADARGQARKPLPPRGETSRPVVGASPASQQAGSARQRAATPHGASPDASWGGVSPDAIIGGSIVAVLLGFLGFAAFRIHRLAPFLGLYTPGSVGIAARSLIAAFWSGNCTPVSGSAGTADALGPGRPAGAADSAVLPATASRSYPDAPTAPPIAPVTAGPPLGLSDESRTPVLRQVLLASALLLLMLATLPSRVLHALLIDRFAPNYRMNMAAIGIGVLASLLLVILLT